MRPSHPNLEIAAGALGLGGLGSGAGQRGWVDPLPDSSIPLRHWLLRYRGTWELCAGLSFCRLRHFYRLRRKPRKYKALRGPECSAAR